MLESINKQTKKQNYNPGYMTAVTRPGNAILFNANVVA